MSRIHTFARNRFLIENVMQMVKADLVEEGLEAYTLKKTAAATRLQEQYLRLIVGTIEDAPQEGQCLLDMIEDSNVREEGLPATLANWGWVGDAHGAHESVEEFESSKKSTLEIFFDYEGGCFAKISVVESLKMVAKRLPLSLPLPLAS